MNRFVYRFAGVAAVLAATTIAIHAQTADQGTAEPVRCGMEWINNVDYDAALAVTARTNPKLYERIMERTVRDDRPALSSVGEEWTFFMYDRVTGGLTEQVATLVYEGPLARVWVDNRDRARISQNVINQLAKGLDTSSGTHQSGRDSKKGILRNDIEVFGTPPTEFEVDGKTDFFLTDLAQNVLGYFSPRDQTDDAGSNQMNILYLDSREGIGTMARLLNTVAHEFQHLIHYGRNKDAETFFNEGCSEEAGLYCGGYLDRRNPTYLGKTNVDLLGFSPDLATVEPDYQRAYTFFHYLREQLSDQFLYEFVGSKKTGMERLDEALTKSGFTMNWRELMKGFAVANYLQTNSDTRYGYKYQIVETWQRQAKHDSSFSGAGIPRSGRISLERYGILYRQFVNPGGIKMRFSGEGDYRVMAIAFRGTTAEILDMSDRTDYTLASGNEPYDRIMLAFVNLAGRQSVSWTVDEVPLGVEDEEIAADRLALGSIAPNPTANETTLRFSAPAAASARIEIIDGRGEIVRTLTEQGAADTVREIRLDVTDLAAGQYFVRLTQEGKSVTRTMIVYR